MRHQAHSETAREGGDFHELTESPRGCYVRLGNVHTGTLRADKQISEAVSHEAAFASCNWDTCLGLDSRVTLDIFRHYGLLKPRNVQMLHFLGQTHSSGDAVGMVGIHHELEVGPYGLSDGLDPPEVLGHSQEPHLHLDSPEASLLEAPGLLGAGLHTLCDVYCARVIVLMSVITAG